MVDWYPDLSDWLLEFNWLENVANWEPRKIVWKITLPNHRKVKLYKSINFYKNKNFVGNKYAIGFYKNFRYIKIDYTAINSFHTVPNDSYRFWADLHLEGHV